MKPKVDEAQSGAVYLRQPPIANMIVEAIRHNADVLSHYSHHAFVVMPNHVHVLLTPAVPLPQLTRSLKCITSKRANAMLGLTGRPFWQDESYDHLVRSLTEFGKIRKYIEENPVRAGLVAQASDYRWSSAAGATGGAAPLRKQADWGNRQAGQTDSGSRLTRETDWKMSRATAEFCTDCCSRPSSSAAPAPA